LSFWKDFFGNSKVRQRRAQSQATMSHTSKPILSPEPDPDIQGRPKPEPKPDIPKREPKLVPKRRSEAIHDHEKEFLQIFKQLTYQHRSWDVWKDFVVMAACALSNPVDSSHYDEREAIYMQIIKTYKKSEQELFPQLLAEVVMALEKNPEQDFLGHIFMGLDLGSDSKKQIFTPYHVCQLMAEVTMGDFVQEVKDKGYITICDPCCGAGATLIASLNVAKEKLGKERLNFQNHVLFAAQDIDQTAALMCYIQLSLLGVAAYIKIGNTLTDPMVSGDSLENYWFTPMYFSDVWVMRRLIRGSK